MRYVDADKLYPDCMTKNGTLAISQSQIANAPTVKPRIEYGTDGQPYILSITNGIEERPQGDLISRSEAEKLGATCLAKRNENGQLEAIISLDNAPTVDLKDIYQEGHYDGHLEGYTKAINEVRPQEVYMNGKDYNLYLEGYKQGKKDFERPQGKWIPVSERLPEKMGTYLVTLEYEEYGKGITTLWYHGEGIGWDLRVADVVTAWQPLPEPYKEGGAE